MGREILAASSINDRLAILHPKLTTKRTSCGADWRLRLLEQRSLSRMSVAKWF